MKLVGHETIVAFATLVVTLYKVMAKGPCVEEIAKHLYSTIDQSSSETQV